MPRLKQVSRKEIASARILETYDRHFGDREPTVTPGAANGTPGNWWTVFALDPALFEMMLDRHQWQFSDTRKLDPLLRELGIARAGWARESRFVFSQHCKGLRRAGATEEQIAAIPCWSSATCFDGIQRTVLGYADDLVLGGGRSPDERFRQLKAALPDTAILELTYIICTYDMSAKMCRALRLEFDDVDDRITEVTEQGS